MDVRIGEDGRRLTVEGKVARRVGKRDRSRITLTRWTRMRVDRRKKISLLGTTL